MEIAFGISIYLLVMSVVAFASYGLDKRHAINHQRRTPERTLIALALAGGATGAWVGMLVFHHKTRKTKFRVVVPPLAIAQLITLAWIAMRTLQNLPLLPL